MINTVDPPDVFGSTIFCDDIRQEITGKLFFIGVYRGAMLVNSNFPLTLPRFCFSISIFQKAEIASSPIAIRIFVPGDSDDSPSIEGQMGEGTEGAFQKSAELNSELLGVPHSERAFATAFANLMFDNFVLKEAGNIKVRADVNGKRYRLGSLRISQAPHTPVA